MNDMTVASRIAAKTSETGKTGHAKEDTAVTNQAFMAAIFKTADQNTRPIVVSLNGNPGEAKGKEWAGCLWSGEKTLWPPSANNYFSLATFEADDNGVYRRQKRYFSALHSLMLDDVGTKVDKALLALPPSWLLETSPGNYQAGYILSTPLTDADQADLLMKAILKAGLSDPGAGGPTARLARLPCAVNGKHGPPFACSLELWAPDTSYSIDELVTGFGLDMSPSTNRTYSKATSNPTQPLPRENPVVSALVTSGLYKKGLDKDKHDITCPWVKEHTNAVDGGTAYFEPTEERPIGGFKCLHGHCSHRHIRDLLTHLGVSSQAASMKPIIQIVRGEFAEVVDAAERALAERGGHYQRGGMIVSVFIDPVTKESRVEGMTQQSLTLALAKSAIWQSFNAQKESWTAADPSSRHITTLLGAGQYKHLPALAGIARQPYLRVDGSLMRDSGYDPQSLMLGEFDPGQFQVTNEPTESEARDALQLLEGLLAEFSFQDDNDLAAALSALLSAAIRPSLATSPMFHVKAHSPGSGKSYLCDLFTAFATPQKPTPLTFPSEDDECKKALLAELMQAPAVVNYDNLTTDLVAHKSLCTVLTAEHMKGRILGSSKTASVTTRTLFLSSGNNVDPVDDMTRRCVVIRLAPPFDIPAEREYQNPRLVVDVLQNRGSCVSAALTIIRAWIAAGRPIQRCKPLASYNDWSDYCRQPLLWLGCHDPAETLFQSISTDPEREILGRLLATWHGVFGSRPMMIREVLAALDDPATRRPELMEALEDVAGDAGSINRRRLGRWLKRHAGRMVEGFRITKRAGNGSAERWAVEKQAPVSPVLPVTPPLS